MRKFLIAFVLTSVSFIECSLSATLEHKGSLTLPENGNSNIDLELQSLSVGIDPAELLKVFVGRHETCCDDKTPIAGQYRVSGSRLSFDPAFELIEGQPYTIMSGERNAEGLSEYTLTEFTIESTVPRPYAEVVAIYPSAADVPENTLRFYIHFSNPMQPNVSNNFIKLLDSTGTQDTQAFMAFKQELWSEDRKRLTLLMDPGRIKRGVTRNMTLGPALEKNASYSIVIDAGWPIAGGKQQISRFEKVFSVSQALRTIPSIKLWQIAPPRSRSRDPLVIEFDRIFDYQLAQSSLRVMDANGQIITGTVSVENDERSWRFEPQDVWPTAKVRITVDARLEDVAGNNFRDLLDHSVDNKVKTIDQQTITVKLKPATQ